MKEKLIDALVGEGGIFKVRSLITFGLLGLVAYLTFNGEIDPSHILGMTGTAVGFYFGTRSNDNK